MASGCTPLTVYLSTELPLLLGKTHASLHTSSCRFLEQVSLYLRMRIMRKHSMLFMVSLLIGSANPALPQSMTAQSSHGQPSNSVSEEMFVQIGGIPQWITIKGDDRNNPVLLFLHGGPGDALSPLADAMYAGWEKDFTLVQWDQ